MKKLWGSLIFGVLMFASIAANAADTKVNGRVFADWYLNTTDGAESENAFSISRAYVTVKSKLSDYTSVRVTSDIRETGAFDGYSIIMKYAYIDWKPKFAEKKLTVRFGLHATPYIDVMNKVWSRRYLEKTASDKYKFLTSSDLGAGFIVGLGENGKVGSVQLHIFNGTSYTEIEEMNKNKNFNAFVQLNPLTNNEDLQRTTLVGQAYLGTQNEIIDTTDVGTDADAAQYKHQLVSVGGMLGYRDLLDLGIDMNFATMGMGYDGAGTELEDLKSSAMSFFGTWYFGSITEDASLFRTLNLFGRFDVVDPDTDTDNDAYNFIIAGVECAPVKGFKASVNYRVKSHEDDALDNESYLYLNTLFKF